MKTSPESDPRLLVVEVLLELADEHDRDASAAWERKHFPIAERYLEVATVVRAAARTLSRQRLNLLAYEEALRLEHRPCRDTACPYCRRRRLHVLPGGAT